MTRAVYYDTRGVLWHTRCITTHEVYYDTGGVL